MLWSLYGFPDRHCLAGRTPLSLCVGLRLPHGPPTSLLAEHTSVSTHDHFQTRVPSEQHCPLLLTTDRMLLPSVPRVMLLPSTMEAVRSSIHRVRDVVVRPSAPSLAECIGLDPERCVSDPL